MRNHFAYTIFSLLLSTGLCYAQSDIPLKDQFKPLFSHHWTSDYSILRGRKVENKDTLTQISYSFKRDHTFILRSHLGMKEVTGNWEYDPKGKMINLKVNSRHTSSIILISDTIVIMKFSNIKGLPSDLASRRFYYKPRPEL